MPAPLDDLAAAVAALGPPHPAMAEYLEKVRSRASTVTDADVDALRTAGCSEDEIFEQTVAVAVAQGLRRYDAAMDVLG